MKVVKNLECTVRPAPVTSSRVKAATEVAIWLGSHLVATKMCGGYWTPAQGLAEFRRNPGSFKKQVGYETAKLMKLAA